MVFGNIANLETCPDESAWKTAANGTKKLSHDPAILDSGASTIIFCQVDDPEPGSYSAGSKDVVRLAAGGRSARCLGKGTIRLAAKKLPDSIHADQLNGNLISVGNVCDQDKIVDSTKNEAIVLNTEIMSVKKSDVDLVV